MTVIAAIRDSKLGTVFVASERRNIDDSGRIYHQTYPKIQEHHGIYYGTAGEVRGATVAEQALVAFINNKNGGLTPDKLFKEFGNYLYERLDKYTKEENREFSMLIFYQGRVFDVDDSCAVLETEGPWAIGSGAELALGALHVSLPAGNAVIHAVEAAIKYDSGCGGEVDFFSCSEASLQLHSDNSQLESGGDGHSHLAPDIRHQSLEPNHD